MDDNEEATASEGTITEGLARINLKKGVFFNPKMELCRDITSLAISTLPELTICDGMCATGVRGIRYALENENVKHVALVDMDENAIALATQNIIINNLDFPVVQSDINHFLYRGGEKFNFVELDPFGSPVPFIRSALLNLRASKEGFLSVTATDTAVLCGAQTKACQIYYGARPLHNYLCHEAGARILLSHIARVASPLEMGIEPIITLSKHHYFKLILKVKKGAVPALDSVKQLGYVSWCPNCFTTKTWKDPFIKKECECGHIVEWSGPSWLSNLFDKEALEKMKSENINRNYANKKVVSQLLHLLSLDAEMPPFYFDIHKISDKLDAPSKKFEIVFTELERRGFRVSRTHFNPNAIKTDADAQTVFDVIGAK